VFHGDQENIDRVLQYIKGNGSKIDFNKIIPMPDNIYRGDLGKRERELYSLNNLGHEMERATLLTQQQEYAVV
jgi:hypothetical protein